MSIQTEITRISGLVTRLITKLRSLGVLDNNSHDFEDAVAACENLGANTEEKTVVLGEDPPPNPILPSQGYGGMSKVAFTVNGNQVNPAYIVQGSTILGIPGTAITGGLVMRRASFVISRNNANPMVINISEIYYPSGLPVFPVFNELILFKRTNSFASGKKTCVTVFYNKANGYGEYVTIDGNANFEHNGDASHQNKVQFEYSTDGKQLTITLNSATDVFHGNYVLDIYY